MQLSITLTLLQKGPGGGSGSWGLARWVADQGLCLLRLLLFLCRHFNTVNTTITLKGHQVKPAEPGGAPAVQNLRGDLTCMISPFLCPSMRLYEGEGPRVSPEIKGFMLRVKGQLTLVWT